MVIADFVIADFNIFCLNQRIQKKYIINSTIKADGFKIKNISKLYYGDKWPILGAWRGFGYNLYPIDKSGRYDYSRGFFDLFVEDNKKYLILSDLSTEEFAKIIDFYIQQSPIKKICVFVRLDWDNENTVLGTFKKEEFLKKLKQQELLFNTAYLVGD